MYEKTPAVKKSLRSLSLGKELVFDAFEGSGGDMIITHASLEKAFELYRLERVVKKLREPDKNSALIHIDGPEVVESSIDHALVRVHIWMDNGWDAWGIGETTTRTLKSSIDIGFPVKTAERRALDNAIIRFLLLQTDGRRVYSDVEINN